MKINRYVFLFLLGILLAFCYSGLFINIPKDSFFEFKKTVELSSPEVELGFKLKPGSYFLKIKHLTQVGQKKIVSFNEQSITTFYIRKNETSTKGGFAKRTYYFHIKSNQIQENNLLSIKFGPVFPPYVTIYLQNFRKSFYGYGNNISIFFKPTPFFVLDPGTGAIAFLFIYGFLIVIFLLLNSVFKEAIPYSILLLCIFTIVLGAVTINNFLPLFPYTVFIAPSWFWLCFSTPTLVLFLFTFKKPRYEVVEEFRNDRLLVSVKPDLIIPVFLGLLIILFVLRLGAVLQNRVPMGHDTFQYLMLQYNIFFNEPALRGNMPLWLPFMTHGTVSNIWVMISQGLLTAILVPFARFLKHINFLYIFQAGLLFDELVLLFGCVLLAKRYFKSVATILFVASSITFTTISSTQIWYDFHIVYLLPLTLYCFDRALRDASAKYLFLTGLFSTGMLLGNLPYHPPLFAFTILTFCLMLFLCAPSQTLNILRNFRSRFSWRHVLAIVIPCLSAIIVFIFLKRGVEDIISCNAGRSGNFAVNNVKQFLNYGGYVNIRKYSEFISRCSNNIDNTIFGGLLLVPFVVLTLLRVRSRLSYAFGTTAFVMALFSAGILVPLIFYYLFPLAKYYRHIGLIGPLVKLFTVFYAGFGFDVFWRSLRRLKHYSPQDIFVGDKVNLLIPCVVMLYIFILALIQRVSDSPVFDFSPWPVLTESQLYLNRAQISSGMNQLLVISGLFVVFMLAMLRWPRQAMIIGLIFISVHLIDVVYLKVEREYRRVPRVNKNVMDLFNTYDYSFSSNRNQDYFSNDRFLKLVPFVFNDDKLPFDTNEPCPTIGRYGAVYWDMESFLFFDATSSIFHARHILKSIEEFYHIWIPPSEWRKRDVGFPISQSAAFKKLSGYNFPKLQVFSAIHILPTENDVADVMANPGFGGDVLLSSGFHSKLPQTNTPVIIDSKNNISPQANERTVGVDVSVQEFTFNKLSVLVNNNSGADALLYYADAWHPEWYAYVDGKPAFVFKTNIGYKSVIVPPGKSEVTFKFGDVIDKLLFNGMIVIGMCTFCGVVYLLFVELRE